MTALGRVWTVAEMVGRELARRRTALVLLTALPLAFYVANDRNVEVGGVAMAFSVSGAAIFAVVSARGVDRRLVLAGYRPVELMLGRLLVLELMALGIAAMFALIMVAASDPPQPWALAAGVALVGLVAVPFGLAVGALAPSELEAVLVMIGVVGIQISVNPDDVVAKALPFWGPRRVLQIAVDFPHSTVAMALVSVAYAGGLLALGLLLAGRMRSA